MVDAVNARIPPIDIVHRHFCKLTLSIGDFWTAGVTQNLFRVLLANALIVKYLKRAGEKFAKIPNIF